MSTKLKAIPFPEGLLWNRGDRKAKAIQKDGLWFVRILWSDKLGLELKENGFDKKPSNLITRINKAKKLDVDARWLKYSGDQLDESFMQNGITF